MERQLDTLAFVLDEYDRTPRTMAFAARDRAEAEEWQSRLRRRFVEVMGGFPPPCELRAEVIDRRELEKGIQETVLFQSRENLTAFGYLLLPRGAPSPAACVICIPGHGRGVNDLVGITDDGGRRGSPGGYQQDFALQCLGRGYAAFALEPFGFGHRRDDAARMSGAQNTACQPASGAALMLGQTIAGWRVYDVIRTIDYLRTRDEIDAERIGCIGISGGGLIALFAAAVETRLRATSVVGYFCTWRDSVISHRHCPDNYVPGLLTLAEAHDVAGLVAPRALHLQALTIDPGFPWEASRRAMDATAKIYEVFDARDRLATEIVGGPHSFQGEGVFAFLERWL